MRRLPLSVLLRVTAVTGALALAAPACSRSVDEPAPSDFKPSPATSGSAAPTSSSAPGTAAPPATKLEIKDDKLGAGREAKTGDTVSVHYTGTLMNGTKFDSSRDRNKPFDFKLGAGNVIKGWDQGVVGMKVGGKRTLVIPSDLAYGDRGSPPTIPPKSTLKFDIELLEVK
jgi:FKBP-type peptidyl-prolyl cis-trans isomerase